MGREFRLPDLGSGLQEGEIVSWGVAVGDQVQAEATLCEVETEKAVIEIPVPFDGVIARLACNEGETIQVGDVLVEFEGADQGSADEKPPAIERPETSAAVEAPTKNGASVTADRVRALPSVRRIASEHGIDLATVDGTGRFGRITKGDIQRVATAHSADTPKQRAAGQHQRFSMMRRSIAEHMAKSWREIPHVFVRKNIDASGLLTARKMLGQEMDVKIPIEAFLIGAALPALKEYPEFNAVVEDDGITYYDHYHIGAAANTPDGLVVPVVRDADMLGWAELIEAIAGLQQRALARKSPPQELQGATFTVNNIGALGTSMGTSIIQHGTTALIAIGRATEQPVVRDGAVVVRPIAELALAFDHRAIDGGRAGLFIDRIAELLEHPVRGFVT